MLVGREKETIPTSAGAAACTPQSLQERSHFGGGIDLDHSIQVAHVNAKFERACGDYDAVN